MAVALAVSVCAFVAIPGVATAAVPGSISGRVTDASTGLPVSGLEVCAYTAFTESFEECDSTEGAGEYTIGNLEPGSYKVQFEGGSFGGANYSTQWFSGKTSFFSANPVTVTEGTDTPNVNAAMFSLGRVAGTVTDAASHAPIAGIEVCVSPTGGSEGFEFFFTCTTTNGAGQYLTSPLEAGTYKVEFSSPTKYNESLEKSELVGPNYVTQYYSGQARPESAGTITVSNGATTSGIDAALQAGATISGTVTDATTNGTLQGIDVCAWGSVEFQCALTDTAGNYSIPTLTPGSYKVEFTPEYFFSKTAYKEGKRVWVRSELPLMDYLRQYYNDKFSFEAAEAVTANGGATASNINAKMTKEVQPPPPAPKPGVAKVGKKASYKGGKALLPLTCTGAGACKGSLTLTAKAVKSVRQKNGKVKKTMRKVTIGKASFSIPAGKSKTVSVPINGAGKLLLTEAGAKGLKVAIGGTGLKATTVTLKGGAKKAKKPAKKH